MNTLHIPQIFAQLEHYQQHYLHILADPAQYYIVVDDAYIDLWPLKKRQLYLGELLQLWFAKKWQISTQPQFSLELFLTAAEAQQQANEQYIYAISGNLITGYNQSRVWQASQQHSKSVGLSNIARHFFEYKGLQRPTVEEENNNAILL